LSNFLCKIQQIAKIANFAQFHFVKFYHCPWIARFMSSNSCGGIIRHDPINHCLQYRQKKFRLDKTRKIGSLRILLIMHKQEICNIAYIN